MNDFRSNLILLFVGASLATMGFAANKFFEASMFDKVCNLQFCISPFQAILFALVFLGTILTLLYFYDHK